MKEFLYGKLLERQCHENSTQESKEVQPFVQPKTVGHAPLCRLTRALGLILATPDIALTDRERELFDEIRFHSNRHDEIRASIMPMVALYQSLFKRDAIPKVRLRYFTDPERNPGGRGNSHQDVFERNGTSGAEILAHPNFMKYLQYFVCGPNLPPEVINEFKEAANFSGHLTGGDIVDLIPKARSTVRLAQLDPHEASDEFHKLALECGAMPSSAESIRNAVRSVKVRG